MPRCPHCKESGVGVIGKLMSSEAMPVRCRACGKLSALSSFLARLLTQLFVPSLGVVAIVATQRASLVLLLGGTAAFCALWIAGSLLLPLTTIKRREFTGDR